MVTVAEVDLAVQTVGLFCTMILPTIMTVTSGGSSADNNCVLHQHQYKWQLE